MVRILLYCDHYKKMSLCPRRGDIPFMRRPVARPGIESDEDNEPKSEHPEPKPEWTTSGLLFHTFIWRNQPNKYTNVPIEQKEHMQNE